VSEHGRRAYLGLCLIWVIAGVGPVATSTRILTKTAVVDSGQNEFIRSTSLFAIVMKVQLNRAVLCIHDVSTMLSRR